MMNNVVLMCSPTDETTLHKQGQYRILPRQGWGGGKGVHVARLNFKTSCVGVYKCLSLIVGFITSRRLDFRGIATFNVAIFANL